MSAIGQISGYRQRPPLLPTGDATTAVIERVFAEEVAKHVGGEILRYSDRLHLLRAARRLHIERFRANLIIALVQRQSQTSWPKMQMPIEPSPTPRRWRIASAVGIVLLVEAITVVTLCWAWRV